MIDSNSPNSYNSEENGVFAECEYREIESGDSDVYFKGKKVGTSVRPENILPWSVNLIRYCAPVSISNTKLLLLDCATKFGEIRTSKIIDLPTLSVSDGPPEIDDTESSSASNLSDGRILILGGKSGGLERLRLWNPSSGEIEAGGQLNVGRVLPKFVQLSGERVLIVGGQDEPAYRWVVPEIECYNYKTKTSSVVGKLEGFFMIQDVFLLSDEELLSIGFYSPQEDNRKTINFAEVTRITIAD